MARIDAIRQISIAGQTYYRWRKQYGGFATDRVKELRSLHKENDRLRRAVSDLAMDKLGVSERRACRVRWLICLVSAAITFLFPTISWLSSPTVVPESNSKG